MPKIDIENIKRRPYPKGDEPKRWSCNIPSWLESVLKKTFDLGNKGNGKKSYISSLGLVMVLYCVGCKSVSADSVAMAIARLFPDARQIWASNLRALADQLGEGDVPEEPK